MKFARNISRNVDSMVRYILDNFCPPILRDCYPLMYPIYWLGYGKGTGKFLKFKEHYPQLSDAEYAQYYADMAKADLSQRPTDLDRAGLQFVLSNCVGDTCLDVGCGRGYLAKQIVSSGVANVYGLDLEPSKTHSKEDGYTFVQGFIESIPFPDGSFDTVVCTHVLEHVRDLKKATKEILRVAKKRVIIVLPKEREYRYVANLHIRFFPYMYDVQMAFPFKDTIVKRVGGDWGVIIHKSSPTD